MSRAEDNPGYVDEAYLRLLAELTRPIKARSYALMRAQKGDKVLDVGCGPGTDTVALAARVGPGGEVVGVDYDHDMVSLAERAAAEAGVERWVRHRCADAASLPFPTGYFDACRCERVFQHLPEPGRVLAEMLRVTKPGGWIVALDSDFGTLSVDTSELDVERRLMRLLADRFHHDGYAGRRLYRLFRRSGLAEVTVELFGLPFTGYALMRRVARFDELEALARQLELITEDELQLWRTSLSQAEAAGGFFGSLTQVLVAGCRP
ncbi:MAG: methyltransferase domain-containing protein [Trueperaceae bacterium]|nr:MAG: methyltransferase domain-containing protein [Trueperaceae bacterium]